MPLDTTRPTFRIIMDTGNTNNAFTKQGSRCVQSNSVQSQFTALTLDRDKFRREKEAAEREQKRANDRLQQLKAAQIDYMSKIRMAQEELGDLTRKETMLNQEQVRLGRVQENERKALESCAVHTENLLTKERELTEKYCAEIDGHNDETASLLEQQRQKNLQRLLSLESVEAEILGKIPDSIDRESFDESFNHLKEGTEILKRERKNFDCLKLKVQKHKAVAAGKTSALQSEQGDTEAASNHFGGSHSEQMDLFYGMESEEMITSE